MFSEDILEKILTDKKIQDVPIEYQVKLIRTIEDTLEQNNYVIKHIQSRYDSATVLEQ